MRSLVGIALLLINIEFCFSQIDVSSILKSKNSFKIETNASLNKDSLVIVKEKTVINQHYLDYQNDYKTHYRYMTTVFYYTDSKSNHTYYTKQWHSPIIIYLDKKIDNELRKSFIAFLTNYKNINNLEIAITKNIDKANYLIRPSNAAFKAKTYSFKNEIDKSNFVFNNGNYTIIPGGNQSIKGCILELNTDKNSELVKKNLNQLFFLSLGRFFVIPYDTNETSFVSQNYQAQNTLSELDLKILKIHYNHIYDYPINRDTFLKLVSSKK